MADALVDFEEGDAAAVEALGQAGSVVDVPPRQGRLETTIAAARRAGIRAEEKRASVTRYPVGEFVDLAVERVEQDHARNPVVGAAAGERPGGGEIAAAIGDQHDRHAREARRGAGIAGETGELPRRLIEIAAEGALLPKA